ncbi:MAG TPA: hypothetical protein VIJ75_18140 [Hanamia sp.]
MKNEKREQRGLFSFKILPKSIKERKLLIINIATSLLVLLCIFAMCTDTLAQSSSVITGGVFIPRNGAYEGRIGYSHVIFDRSEGGVMSVVSGNWPSVKRLAKLDMVFDVKTNSNRSVVLRQSFDKTPQILFLEEGNDHIGLRVLFKLFSKDNVYYGYGMTETWLYPDGELFITAAARFENTEAQALVTKAQLDIDLPTSARKYSEETIQNMEYSSTAKRYILLTKSDSISGIPSLSLYWRTGMMEHDTYIHRSSFGLKGAPAYFRWPDYLRQAFTQLTEPPYSHKEEKVSWPPGGGVHIDKIISNHTGLHLNWPVNLKHAGQRFSFNTLFRLAMNPSKNAVKEFVETERKPIKFIIHGGVIHGNIKSPEDMGYNDQEGCYEIRKTDQKPLTIILPEGMGQTIRVKIVGLTGHGAVTAAIDGKPLVPQLSSDGGIADDPLAPIDAQPEAPADATTVTIKLTNKQQTLVVNEEDGIQLVYQSRDHSRNMLIYSTKSGPSWSSLHFSLIDGHATKIRAYGKEKWAFTDNLLHWFAWMGYTPQQMINQLRGFEIIKNGPDSIIFKYISDNANDAVQSEYTVRISAASPAMAINVHGIFTVLKQWPYNSVQFFDGFPFRGVRPQDWWYDNVLHMSADGRWQIYNTKDMTQQGNLNINSENLTAPTFISLYQSDRGNTLILVKDLKPNVFSQYAICGNYIDLHMNPSLNSSLLNKGSQLSVDYELSIWGNELVTPEQLIQIGKNSIKAGNLILPPLN